MNTIAMLGGRGSGRGQLHPSPPPLSLLLCLFAYSFMPFVLPHPASLLPLPLFRPPALYFASRLSMPLIWVCDLCLPAERLSASIRPPPPPPPPAHPALRLICVVAFAAYPLVLLVLWVCFTLASLTFTGKSMASPQRCLCLCHRRHSHTHTHTLTCAACILAKSAKKNVHCANFVASLFYLNLYLPRTCCRQLASI